MICFVSDLNDSRNFSIYISEKLIRAIDQLADKLNNKTGHKIYTRNNLIAKALKEYYVKELAELEKGGKKVAEGR